VFPVRKYWGAVMLIDELRRRLPAAKARGLKYAHIAQVAGVLPSQINKLIRTGKGIGAGRALQLDAALREWERANVPGGENSGQGNVPDELFHDRLAPFAAAPAFQPQLIGERAYMAGVSERLDPRVVGALICLPLEEQWEVLKESILPRLNKTVAAEKPKSKPNGGTAP
jgi:hypothetical protein